MTASSRGIGRAENNRITARAGSFCRFHDYRELHGTGARVAEVGPCFSACIVMTEHGGARRTGHLGDPYDGVGHRLAPFPDGIQERDLGIFAQPRAMSLGVKALLHPSVIKRGDRKPRREFECAILYRHVLAAHRTRFCARYGSFRCR